MNTSNEEIDALVAWLNADSRTTCVHVADMLLALKACAEAAAKERDKLRKALKGASHALRSYQYGNGSTELAQSIADACDAALEDKAP
jgi:hypothetical protein